MSDERLVATVVPVDDGFEVRSPGVGWWSAHPRAGELLAGGSAVGLLTRLRRRFVVELPAGPAGRVTELAGERRVVPVEYGQKLFRLAPIEAASVGPGPAGDAEGNDTAGASALAIRAPSDGVFYRRPAPDADAYVEAGQQIRRGQTVGLVEVMKTFNQIVYDGPGHPEQARVVEIRAEDGEEVRAGQLLLVLES